MVSPVQVVLAVIFAVNQEQCEAGIVQELLRTVIQGGGISNFRGMWS